MAKANNVRETAKQFSLQDDKADVITYTIKHSPLIDVMILTTALMTLGNTATPVCLQITTKGEEAAVEPPFETASSSIRECWLTFREIINTVRTYSPTSAVSDYSPTIVAQGALPIR